MWESWFVMQHLNSWGCHNQFLLETKDGGVTKDFMPVCIFDYHIWIAENFASHNLDKKKKIMHHYKVKWDKFITKLHGDSFEQLQEEFHPENEMRTFFFFFFMASEEHSLEIVC